MILKDYSESWFYNFKNIDFSKMNNILNNINWYNLYFTNDINIDLTPFINNY